MPRMGHMMLQPTITYCVRVHIETDVDEDAVDCLHTTLDRM